MYLHSASLRKLTLLACASVGSMLSACGGPGDGYYDANGHYVYNSSYNKETHAYEPVPAGDNNDPRYDGSRPTYTTTTTTYDRPGYYDYNGYYMARDSGLSVPPDMFPPRGMCRVWLTERAAIDQPSVESCNGIRSRVPAGAYVIYGG